MTDSKDILDIAESKESAYILYPGIPRTGVTLISGVGVDLALSGFVLALGKVVTEGGALFDIEPNQRGEFILATSLTTSTGIQEKLLELGFSSLKSKVVTDWDIQKMEFLENEVRMTRPVLIVIDCLKSCGFDQNGIVGAHAVSELTRLSEKYSCAVVLVSHPGTEASTSVLGACAAAIMVSDADVPSGCVGIKSLKYRVENTPIDITLDLDKGTYLRGSRS